MSHKKFKKKHLTNHTQTNKNNPLFLTVSNFVRSDTIEELSRKFYTFKSRRKKCNIRALDPLNSNDRGTYIHYIVEQKLNGNDYICRKDFENEYRIAKQFVIWAKDQTVYNNEIHIETEFEFPINSEEMKVNVLGRPDFWVKNGDAILVIDFKNPDTTISDICVKQIQIYSAILMQISRAKTAEYIIYNGAEAVSEAMNLEESSNLIEEMATDISKSLHIKNKKASK